MDWIAIALIALAIAMHFGFRRSNRNRLEFQCGVEDEVYGRPMSKTRSKQYAAGYAWSARVRVEADGQGTLR